jgi:hypothetical protein
MKSIFDRRISRKNPALLFFDREGQIHSQRFYIDFDLICPKRDEILTKFATHLRKSLPDGFHLYVDGYDVSICDRFDSTVIDSYGDVVLEKTRVGAVVKAIAASGRALTNDIKAFCSSCPWKNDGCSVPVLLP